MLLAIGAAAAALLAVAGDLLGPRLAGRWRAHRASRSTKAPPILQDPGRELRAEQRARALLRSCVNSEDWEMYRDLGFLRVWSAAPAQAGDRCAYLLYPHQPIVAYLPETRRLLGEYCVSFEDPSKPYGSGRLPDADDVLAKWMALTGDEQGLIGVANMHLAGRQVDRGQVERDLRRLAQWDQARRGPRSEAAPAPIKCAPGREPQPAASIQRLAQSAS